VSFPTSSQFLRHEACPRCRESGKDREGNNLGVYDDGHTHCFSCGHYTPSDAVKNVERMVAANDVRVEKKGIYLPDGTTSTIDAMGLEWLSKYGIKWNEVQDNGILWNKTRMQLIFPYRDGENNLLAFQARCFALNDTKKWITYGNVNDLTHLLGDSEGAIIVVEDIVSAIKVSRHSRCMPLFGSHLSLQRMNRLRFLTKKLLLWLDGDKYPQAMRYAAKAAILGMDVHAIYSEKDPKEHTDEEILSVIRNT
jgi:hypothetical protein